MSAMQFGRTTVDPGLQQGITRKYISLAFMKVPLKEKEEITSQPQMCTETQPPHPTDEWTGLSPHTQLPFFPVLGFSLFQLYIKVA